MMSQRRFYQRPISSYENDADLWDYHYNKIVSSLDGTDEQKEAIIRKRILRYFGQFKIDSQSYFSIRHDVNFHQPNIHLTTEKLVMYGIDYMTIERAKNYFSGFITNIRRMDDSHFIVEFRNQGECLAAINKYKLGSDLISSPQHMYLNGNQGWVEMKPYYEFTFERKLMVRFATDQDRPDNICSATKQSCNLAYSEAKRRFMKSLREGLGTQDKEQNHRSARYRNFEHQKQNFNMVRPRSNSRSRDKNLKCDHFENCRNNKLFTKKPIFQKCFAYNTNRFDRFDRFNSRFGNKTFQNRPKFWTENQVKESDFKFQLYLKKRNQKQFDASFNQRILNDVDLNCQKKLSKDDREYSTKDNQCDIEFIGSKSNGKGQIEQSKDPLNTSQMDFQQFLERLKLQDTKNQYSAFELDDIDC